VVTTFCTQPSWGHGASPPPPEEELPGRISGFHTTSSSAIAYPEQKRVDAKLKTAKRRNLEVTLIYDLAIKGKTDFDFDDCSSISSLPLFTFSDATAAAMREGSGIT
jgi:hypothetical protein